MRDQSYESPVMTTSSIDNSKGCVLKSGPDHLEILEGENIICISLHGWDTLWSRVQPLMSLLADTGNRVLFVEPIPSLPTAILFPEYRVLRAGFSTNVKKVKEGLYVLTPPWLSPFASRSGFVCKINQSILQRIINSWLRKLEFRDPILWTYSPYSVHLIGKLGEKAVVYDCTDERIANPLVSKKHIRSLEIRLMQQADLVFVTAHGLLERKRVFNPHTYLAPNGVDFLHFSRAWSTDLAVPEDVKDLPRPILGFVGAIAYWIDLDLIEFVARARPDWSIVMVGPLRAGMNINRFRHLSNIHFVGKRDWVVLPRYLRAFDVCLSPFKLSKPITETANPLKIYEYLAAGRPVVSTDMPEVRQLRDVIRIADSKEDFVEQIRAALQEDGAAARQARIEVARNYDWPVLLGQMSEKIRLQWKQSSSAALPQC
jgi:glycosyltransferase involved in cell wall biosynthesis